MCTSKNFSDRSLIDEEKWKINKFLREGDKMQRFKQPLKQGLYNPKFEHDACGIGLIAHLKKDPSTIS